MKFLLIILAYLSIWPTDVSGQDLEQIIQPKLLQLSVDDTDTLAEDSLVDLLVSAGELSKDSNTKKLGDPRDPNTYRKEEYIHTLLRHTYYQRLQIPAWAKYVSPGSWTEKVTKWRYWIQLKNYLARNDTEILVLRSKSDAHPVDSLLVEEDTITIDSLDSIATADSSYETLAAIDTDAFIAFTTANTPPPSPEIEPEESTPTTKDISTTSIVPTEKKPVNKQKEREQTVVDAKPKENSSTKEQDPPVRTKVVTEDEKNPEQEAIEPKPETPQIAAPVSASPSAPFNELKGRLPWPVKKGRVTDRFGIRQNAEARGLRPENYGIDMVCPPGTIVSAIHDGVVLMARRQSPYDFIVTVKHGSFTTAHYYLINPYVQAGDAVKKGQALGQLRTSVAEADFHFEIWNNQDRMNPEVWLVKK